VQPDTLAKRAEELATAGDPGQLLTRFASWEEALDAGSAAQRADVLARCSEALLRAGLRVARPGPGPALVFVEAGREVWRGGGRVLALGRSRLLFRLLETIAVSGDDLDREQLYARVWELPFRPPSATNSLHVAVNRLKQRLVGSGLALVATGAGGYRLLAEQRVVRFSGPAPTSAPEPPTDPPGRAFVGRARELDELDALLDEPGLVTLWGPGGVGKTRLARALCAGRAGPPAFVDLAPVRDRPALLGRVAAALHIEPAGDLAALEERVRAGLDARGDRLVVLDNFEQLTALAADTVGAWLTASPTLRLLVTSRERLRLTGERALELGPLSAEDSVSLLLDRAEAARRGSAPVPRDLARRLVDGLDRLPLAIELAAARLGLLSMEGLLQRLDRRLDLLAAGPADAPPRHRTIRSTIEWSWELLSPAERDALAQCAVFEGPFDADAAEVVLSVEEPGAPWTLDLLDALRSRSMLQLEAPARPGGAPRMRLLGVVRDFASQRLGADGGVDATRDRHGSWCVGLGEELVARLRSPDAGEALAALVELQPELLAARQHGLAGDTDLAARATLVVVQEFTLRGPHDRAVALLREALEQLGTAPAQHATRLTVALGDALIAAGRHREALELGERAAASEPVLPPRLRAELARMTGNARRQLGDLDGAAADYGRALEAFQQARDRRLAAVMLGSLAVVEQTRGRFDIALDLHRRALDIHRALGNRRSEAVTLGNLGNIRVDTGQHREAEAAYRAALRLQQELGNRRSWGLVRCNLAYLHQDMGRLEEAEAGCRDALAVHRELGARRSEAFAALVLGSILAERGRPDEAEGSLAQSIRLYRAADNRPGLVRALSQSCAFLSAQLRLSEAEEALEEARQSAGEAPTEATRALLDAASAQLEVARAAAAGEGEDQVAERADAARRRLADRTASSIQARILLRQRPPKLVG